VFALVIYCYLCCSDKIVSIVVLIVLFPIYGHGFSADVFRVFFLFCFAAVVDALSEKR